MSVDEHHARITRQHAVLVQMSEYKQCYRADVAALCEHYNALAVNVLADFYAAQTPSERSAACAQFTALISAHSVLEANERMYAVLCEHACAHSALCEQLNARYAQNNWSTLVQKFKDARYAIAPERNDYMKCELCGGEMSIWSERSEMQCTQCNNVCTLQGEILDDSQIFNQQVMVSRTKKYDPNTHCAKWLDSLLAQEDTVIPEKVLDEVERMAVSAYTRGTRLRPMTNMQCIEVRKWLQIAGYARYYNNAPKIRKLITARHGRAVVPPQLSDTEKQEILLEYNLSMNAYERVIRDANVLREINVRRIRNKLYNPFIIWHIMFYILDNDPRLPALLETIHLQSPQTLVKNDIIWRHVCRERNRPYTATNPNKIL